MTDFIPHHPQQIADGATVVFAILAEIIEEGAIDGLVPIEANLRVGMVEEERCAWLRRMLRIMTDESEELLLVFQAEQAFVGRIPLHNLESVAAITQKVQPLRRLPKVRILEHFFCRWPVESMYSIRPLAIHPKM